MLLVLPVTVIVFWLWLNQESMIFPAPNTAGVTLTVPGFFDVSLKTSDGEILRVFWRLPDTGKPVIIVFHGNGDAALFQQTKGRMLARAGFGVLLAEYRGYGGSTGSPSENGLHLDALAAYDFARNQTEVPIGVYAHSLGTGVALELALKRKVFALVLESPFDSLQAVAQSKMTWLPMSALLKHPFRSDHRIGKIDVPILIMHGNQDRVVPIEHGQRLVNLAPEGTDFVEISGAGHNDINQFGTIEQAIAFFRQAQIR
ncbi:MAG: alpha/beta hydrolase [Rhizobiaceae bacterium]